MAIWPDIRDAAIAALPRWARQMYGYAAPPPMTPGRRTEIRRSLGVLDAMFLGRPGLLEAWLRIALPMPAAQRMKLIRLLTTAMAAAATLGRRRRLSGRLRLDRARAMLRLAARCGDR